MILAWLSVLLSALALFPRYSMAQDPGQENAEEIIANLCAGRVVIGVAKDGIVVATLENPVEPGTRPPMIVPISDDRVAVLLGAADWWLPDQNRELARLDKELPDLPPEQGLRDGPHLQASSQEGAGSEATDIEQIADRLRGRLSAIAEHIHGNLKLADGEPLLQMVLADYAPSYGPEVWLIQYSVEQDPEQGDYWQTRVLQPQYTQLWPPEKGQPRGLIEISYPAAPTLASLIRSGDAHLAQSISTAPGAQQTSEEILAGDVQKLPAVDVAAFLRTCLGTLTVPKARMVEAEINEKLGIGWFVQPPAEEERPGAEQARPAGAPSLRRPTKPDGPGRF
ncbi:MAG: hypothetical protein WBE86_13755 [Candidatus Acidiferrales bacterium]